MLWNDAISWLTVYRNIKGSQITCFFQWYCIIIVWGKTNASDWILQNNKYINSFSDFYSQLCVLVYKPGSTAVESFEQWESLHQESSAVPNQTLTEHPTIRRKPVLSTDDLRFSKVCQITGHTSILIVKTVLIISLR